MKISVVLVMAMTCSVKLTKYLFSTNSMVNCVDTGMNKIVRLPFITNGC